jgi:hypothetical protein
MKRFIIVALFMVVTFISTVSLAKTMTGEGPNLGSVRITQDDIESGLPLPKILEFGQRIFTTPFNKSDGYGDGPFNISEGDPRELGNRPTLQHNGTFLRVNGLDAQTCLECHFIIRNSTIPATLGIGGVAGANANAIFMPSMIDVADINPGEMNGRFINPPFLFGSGGVELLAQEMTIRLQELKNEALNNPGTEIDLIAKGVYFGEIVSSYGGLDTSGVEGVDEDLVVRPFGRKGEFATVRAFDLGAMQFHFGMQPIEVVGPFVDADGDGVMEEILAGEISALHIFGTTLRKPFMESLTKQAEDGFVVFQDIGCGVCHIPFLNTESEFLMYRFPEVETDPNANIFYKVNLTQTSNFKQNKLGGIIVPLFADLKRHDMGPGLAESFDLVNIVTNAAFTTARLWGVRDTAPYLHDGRALTLTEAILMHGGEAQDARDKFNGLSGQSKQDLISFLFSLRTPVNLSDKK